VDIAWISAVSHLKLSASIEHIDRLALGFEGDSMTVDFAGRRRRQYVNVPPYDIKVQGILYLSDDSDRS
jgi:hypothetical protein